MSPPARRWHRSGEGGRLSKALWTVSNIKTPGGPRKKRDGERNPIEAILYRNLFNRTGQMPPATRSGQKATDRKPQVGIYTESEANTFGIFRNVGPKQERSNDASSLSFAGTSRAVYNRYEAVGNPERREDTSRTRFSWDVETGQWMHKSEWLKMKRDPDTDNSKREVRTEGGDKITGNIPVIGVERSRDNHDIEAQPMESGGSTAGIASGAPENCPDGVIFAPDEGPGEKGLDGEQRRAGPKEPTEVKRQRSDASVPDPDIHQRRRGVALGANTVPKPGEGDAKATSVTQGKCSQTKTTLPLEIPTGKTMATNPEAVVDDSRVNRRRQPQKPIADEGPASRSNIAPEPDQRTTEPPSNYDGAEFVAPKSGYGASLDTNQALLDAQGDVGQSRVLRSHPARRGLPEGVVRDMDSFPKQKKESNLSENQGEKPYAQAAAVVAAPESERISQEPHKASKSREYPRRQPARITRSRKNIPDAAPVSNESQSVPGEQIVVSSALDVQAQSQTQDMVLGGEAQTQAPKRRKRKREETSTPTQDEAPVKTEGRPKRIRRPPKWYEGYYGAFVCHGRSLMNEGDEKLNTIK
ncbi:hypothetical protein GX51_07979 [Blastomyces parvus]|uniref:Uncharacterized protein n=1 Tax=Blastomyces parvus TaxID=2060905 RepID=A0A2B7WHP8_9EURO|nr:hypothetical protein GX51_07979 [Blastomyces parvus]